ncbi:hypothetical protein BDZ89DRAFT_1023273 [Hymenopellis radicata]|nr:hypothetical protein BDZ89DRAFT_1023273 [Hymenopellis radicata]
MPFPQWLHYPNRYQRYTKSPPPGPPPHLAHLPAFNEEYDYVETLDPNRPSSKKELKLYRFLPDCDKADNRYYLGWKHTAYPTRHMQEHASLRIVSWNLDFKNFHAAERVTAALNHLQKVVFGCVFPDDSPGPCVIMLQEVHGRALRHAINKHPWIRRHFMVTPVDQTKFPQEWMHGNVTLIERTVFVREAFTIAYGLSEQQRFAVGISVKMQSSTDGRTRYVLLINTQLDDLPGEYVRYSRRQMQECQRELRESDSFSGGIIAGTMPLTFVYNEDHPSYDMPEMKETNEDFFRKLGLVDVAQGLVGKKGHTWGYQGGRRATKSRPDRIFSFSPPDKRRKVIVSEPEIIGVGLKLPPDLKGLWVSEHFGLSATLQVKD